MLKFFTIIVVICQLSPFLFAETLSPESRLRKLSFKVRGFPPKVSEYRELKKIQSAELENFFKKKTDEYLGNSWADVLIGEKFVEDLRIKYGLYDQDYVSVPQLKNKSSAELSKISGKLSESVLKYYNKYGDASYGLKLAFSKGKNWNQMLLGDEVTDVITRLQFVYQNTQNSVSNTFYIASGILKKIKLDPEKFDEISIYSELSKHTKASGSEVYNELLKQGIDLDKIDLKFLAQVMESYKYELISNAKILDHTRLEKAVSKIPNFQEWLKNNPGMSASGVSSSSIPSNFMGLSLFSFQEISMRYSKTRYSVSAALMRMYFCDEMHLVAVVDKNTKSALAFEQLILNKFSSAPVSTTESKDDHVKAECKACHRKLDPLQKFTSSSTADVDFEIVYDDEDGKEIRISGKGLNEFNNIVKSQNRYKQCQVQKFWNWYIGEDINLTKPIQDDLVKVYDETNSQPKELIKNLVNRAEFYTKPNMNTAPNFLSVKPIFTRCNSCHSDNKKIKLSSMAVYPFAEADSQAINKENYKNIKDIIESLDLENNGADPTMPPKKANWNLSQAEKDAVTRWIYYGARDKDNQAFLTEENVKTLFKKFDEEDLKRAITVKNEPQPKYSKSWSSYINKLDFARTLQMLLPMDAKSCVNYTLSQKLNIFGFNETSTGKPAVSRPGFGFREAYWSCVSNALATLRQWIDSSDDSILRQKIGLSPQMAGINKNALWSSIDEQTRTQIISNLVEYYAGLNLNHTKNSNVFMSNLIKVADIRIGKNINMKITDMTIDLIKLILMDDYFLTY